MKGDVTRGRAATETAQPAQRGTPEPPADTGAPASPAWARHRGARVSAAAALALRNLTSERRRWGVSSIALAIAAMLVLFIQGTVRWIDDSATAYLNHTAADLVVTQRGVDDLLLSQAIVPPAAVAAVQALPGVARVTPILAVNGVLSGRSTPLPVFVIGYQPGGPGGPWQLASGRTPRAADEVALDRALAYTNGVGVGDTVTVLGRSLHVVGLAADTNAAGIFFAFVPMQTAQAIAGAPVISDLLVTLRAGVNTAQVTAMIDQIDGVHGLPTAQMAANDRGMVDAGFAQPVEIIVVVCLIVGLLIAAIVLYTATVEHARDFAVLKAVGARGRVLAGVATVQSLVLSVCGYALGWALAELLALALRTWRPVIDSELSLDLVAEIFGLFVAVNLLALALPLRFLRRVDPQEVFKA
jgi:putative ABC transport system permease protein